MRIYLRVCVIFRYPPDGAWLEMNGTECLQVDVMDL